MHALVFAIKGPPLEQGVETRRWWHIVNFLRDEASSNTAVQELTSNCWLLRAEEGLKFLGHAVLVAHENNLSYTILIVDDATVWQHSITVAQHGAGADAG